jgi:hypothetical protein
MTDTARAPDAADLQAEIESTREDLSHTVDLLAAKLDVKARVRGRAVEIRDDVQNRLRAAGQRARKQAENTDAKQISLGAGLLAVSIAVLTMALWRRNQHSRPRWRR